MLKSFNNRRLLWILKQQYFYQIYANSSSCPCAQCIMDIYNVPWELDDCIMQYKHVSLMLNI